MININKPIENSGLIKLMKLVKNNNCEDNINAFFEELVMNAHFLVAVKFSEFPNDVGDGTVVFENDADMEFQVLTSKDDKIYYPIFTDWNELNKFIKEDINTIIIDFDKCISLIENNNVSGIVINPFGENMILERKMLMFLKAKKDNMRNGISKQRVSKGTKVILGEPKNYPTRMIEAIKRCLEPNKSVKKVWLRLMVRNREQSYLLIVDFDGKQDEVFQNIANAARPYLEGMNLDLVSVEKNLV